MGEYRVLVLHLMECFGCLEKLAEQAFDKRAGFKVYQQCGLTIVRNQVTERLRVVQGVELLSDGEEALLGDKVHFIYLNSIE